jgi:hypothetical protein
MNPQRIKKFYGFLVAALLLAAGTISSKAAATAESSIPVTMTVTANVAADKRIPQINLDNVLVRQGNSQLKVTDWVPARGERAGLELFILIDDRSDSRISLQYDELGAFINAQPASTLVGVGYMRNATVQIAQDLTSDHGLATRALRLPTGYSGAYGSPYLSMVDLMKRWPVGENRREVVVITDGIGRGQSYSGWHRGYGQDPDADTASAVAQRTGTNIFAIYTPASGLSRHGYWDGMNGQMNLTRLTDQTGGASFYLGLHSPVSIQPYLAQVQTMLDNQYLLSFSAKATKRAGLQPVKISTDLAGVDLAAHDAVWVAGKK